VRATESYQAVGILSPSLHPAFASDKRAGRADAEGASRTRTNGALRCVRVEIAAPADRRVESRWCA